MKPPTENPTPLVSVIVTTRNNEPTIDACLKSIAQQTYEYIELIVVDNHSTDATPAIAREYADKFFTKGPERSVQRNFAASNARGAYVLIIDSDMVLSAGVVESCVDVIAEQPNIRALYIPEESFGEGFWAQCKRLERSFYVGVDGIEAARFFDKQLYDRVGGYNEALTGAEDWDLTNRVLPHTQIGRIPNFIYHNEGRITLHTALKKRFYYNKGFLDYYAKSSSAGKPAGSVLKYYKLYLSKPARLFKNPLHGIGMLYMKTCEFGTGALSMAAVKFSKGSTQ